MYLFVSLISLSFLSGKKCLNYNRFRILTNSCTSHKILMLHTLLICLMNYTLPCSEYFLLNKEKNSILNHQYGNLKKKTFYAIVPFSVFSWFCITLATFFHSFFWSINSWCLPSTVIIHLLNIRCCCCSYVHFVKERVQSHLWGNAQIKWSFIFEEVVLHI